MSHVEQLPAITYSSRAAYFCLFAGTRTESNVVSLSLFLHPRVCSVIRYRCSLAPAAIDDDNATTAPRSLHTLQRL